MQPCFGIRAGLLNSLSFLLICCMSSGSVRAQDRQPAYRNPKLPIEQRIADLMERMTLEEKVAQLTSAMERITIASNPQSSFVNQEDLYCRIGQPFC